MKKKIYFIISSIVAIISNIYMMIASTSMISTLVESAKEMYSIFPQDFQDRAIKIIENAGSSMIIVLSLFSVLFNAIILYNAAKDNLLKKKELVIGLSVASIFTSSSSIVLLLGLVNIIVMALSKRVTVGDYPFKSEKKDIPKIKLDKMSDRDLILSVLLIFIYFTQFFIGKSISVSINTRLIINVVYDVLMIILCISVFYKLLKKDIKLFSSNVSSYFKFILPRIGIMYLVFIVVNLIAIFITNSGTSVNQKLLEALPKLYLIPTAIIYAPIVEEVIFRGVIRRFIKNDIIFIIVSGILFGVLHVVSEASILNVVVMSIPYSLLGCFLAYMYVKTNNILTNITCHALWNSIASIFMSFM